MTERKKNKQTRTTNLFINNLTLTIMKKNLLILAVAGLALASCSNDETVAVNQGDAISFRPLMSNVTRSTDITTSNLQAFYVTANKITTSVTPYFGAAPAVAFTAITTVNGDNLSTSATYTSESKYYWPSDGKLDFIAFAPALEEGYIARTDSTNFTITAKATPSQQTDFVYAVTRNKVKGDNGNVTTLNFRHAQSKVIIKLKNSSKTLDITVRNVAIGNILPTGAFNPVYKTAEGSQIGFSTNGSTISNSTDAESGYYLTGSAWTPSGTAVAYTQEAGTTSYPVWSGSGDISETALPSEMILIPQALTAGTAYESNGSFAKPYISVELKIQNHTDNSYIVGAADGENQYVTAMWPLTAITWLPGHKYTYTVDLSGGGYYTTNKAETDTNLDPILEGAEIKFVGVNVDAWLDGDATSVYTGATPPTANQGLPVVP